jgi:NADH dehydrogenase
MKTLVTGGTGFIGSHLVKALQQSGHQVSVLVRAGSAHGTSRLPQGAEVRNGDVLDPELDKRLSGIDAVIHLVGVIRAFPGRGLTFDNLHTAATANVIRAMKAARVKRLVHMSALGAGPESGTDYFRTKWEAESAVRESGLDWTVMKPSVVFGPGDEFVNMLARQLRMMPAVPVIGDGNYRMQPVAVRNVAEGFIKALTRPETVGQTFEIGGPEQLSYNDILDSIARALGKRRARKIHLPLRLMQSVIKMMEGFAFFPITGGQLKMLLMNNVCDPAPFFNAFEIKPLSFREGIKEYIKP